MMNKKIYKKFFVGTSIAILVLGIFSLAATTPQSSVYAASMGTEDANGFLRYDPLSDYSMATDDEYFIGNAIENFRSDGSMRIDFKGYDTDSLMIGGYFHPENGGTNCATEGGEFYGAKMNGGPHTTSNPPPATETSTTPWPNQNAADTMDLEVINMDGDESRFRPEKTHPTYGANITSQSGNSFPGTDLCDASPDGWIGILAYKLNLDSDCNGQPDRVSVIGFVDVSGLNGDGTPKNNWQRTYKQTFTSIALKSMYQPWVQTVGHSADTYQTLRVDQQSQSAWEDSESNGDNVYRYVTLKEIVNITKDTC